MDQSVQKRWVSFALLSACGGVGFVGLGCEKADTQADRAIVQGISEARKVAAKEGADSESVATILERAAGHQGASGAAVAQARALAGQVHFSRAISGLPAVVTAENRAAQIAREISQLAADISANNALVDAYRGTNPAGQGEDKPLEALAGAQAQLRALIAGLDQQIGALSGQIQSQSKQIADLESQCTAAINEAAVLGDKSEQTKGEESVKLFQQSAGLRNQAGKLSQTLADAKVELGRVQRQVAELSAQKQVAAAGMGALAQQAAEMTGSWTERQKLIVACVASSKQIADPALGNKVKALVAALGEADKLRGEVDAKFVQAIDNYEAAADAANKLTALVDGWLRDYPNAPEKSAWQQLQQTQTFFGYRLIVARAHHSRGAVFAAQRTLLLGQQRMIEGMTPVFKQAGLSVPAGLDAASMAKKIKDATDQARTSFIEADKILEDVVERGRGNDKAAALSARMAAQYALYRLTGTAKYLETSRAMLTEMAGSGEEAGKSQRSFPALPAELEEGIIKHELPAAPATQPAEATTPAPPPGAAPAAGGAGNDHPFLTWQKMMVKSGQAVQRAFESQGGPGAAPAAPGPGQ
jgi:predicted  nucleic acid-binding Zn-ribbon protein